ncbi:hypothetical protein Lbir_1282 [Legionella birminghamensis]|uniref:Uncharacterized protein n=1 Tax=Legionella birminghamensis TaxID=28083 RepID=A0A378I648_9GAMM|nr:hypothetical protein [Legionella birminghamensis]KTC72507.1 hypothetical protein Lbir_1282 [Legionella birminghamensis]STX30639.1 Uncharacterised protein [Legionella birminghamensis]
MSFMNLLETQDSILLAVDKQDDAKQKQIEKKPGIDTPDLPLPSAPKEPEINIPPKEKV